jgi:hexokinase
MPPLFALSKSKQAALDAIAPSFHLSESKLHEITNRFLEEIALGITAYNHPMAMIRMDIIQPFQEQCFD